MNGTSRQALATLAAALAALSGLAISARGQEGGAALFKAKCQSCHGADGKGETPAGKAMKAGDFGSPDVQKMSDADLAALITNGKGKMPAFKALSADQVKDLVAYVRSLGKKK